LLAYSGDEVMSHDQKKASPLKLGNESYGTIKVEEAFLRALEVYFKKKKDSKSPD
jgi:hypothetical protein